ncbi:hypothetical protein PT2222_120311 [Paraburkholderia tropica]
MTKHRYVSFTIHIYIYDIRFFALQGTCKFA